MHKILMPALAIMAMLSASAQYSSNPGAPEGSGFGVNQYAPPATMPAYGWPMPSPGYQPTDAKVPVQHVPQLRQLADWEVSAIEAYVAKYGASMSSENRTALRNALYFLVAIDQSHIPLGRTPAGYFSDYQVFTQMFNRVDWYVRVPEQKLPPFCPSGGQAPYQPLQLEPLPQVCYQPCPPYTPAPCPQPACGQSFGKSGYQTPAMPYTTTVQRPAPGFAVTWVPCVRCKQVHPPEKPCLPLPGGGHPPQPGTPH